MLFEDELISIVKLKYLSCTIKVFKVKNKNITN